MNKVIITVALNGSLPTKEMNSHVPITPEELGVAAAKCQESGASIAHVHARDSNGRPTLDPEVFERIHAEISARTDLIIQISTGARAGTDTEKRAAPVRRIRPEMASLTTGSMNFPNQVYSNSFEVVERLAEVMKEAGTKPEMEIFEITVFPGEPSLGFCPRPFWAGARRCRGQSACFGAGSSTSGSHGTPDWRIAANDSTYKRHLRRSQS